MISRQPGVSSGCYEQISDNTTSTWSCNFHYDLHGTRIHLACTSDSEVRAFWDDDWKWFFEIGEDECEDWDAVVRTIENEYSFPTEKEVEKARKSVLALLSKLEPKK